MRLSDLGGAETEHPEQPGSLRRRRQRSTATCSPRLTRTTPPGTSGAQEGDRAARHAPRRNPASAAGATLPASRGVLANHDATADPVGQAAARAPTPDPSPTSDPRRRPPGPRAEFTAAFARRAHDRWAAIGILAALAAAIAGPLLTSFAADPPTESAMQTVATLNVGVLLALVIEKFSRYATDPDVKRRVAALRILPPCLAMFASLIAGTAQPGDTASRGLAMAAWPLTAWGILSVILTALDRVDNDNDRLARARDSTPTPGGGERRPATGLTPAGDRDARRPRRGHPTPLSAEPACAQGGAARVPRPPAVRCRRAPVTGHQPPTSRCCRRVASAATPRQASNKRAVDDLGGLTDHAALSPIRRGDSPPTNARASYVRASSSSGRSARPGRGREP